MTSKADSQLSMQKTKEIIRRILCSIFQKERVLIWQLNVSYYIKLSRMLLSRARGRLSAGSKRQLPLIIQLPITNRCNLKCKMCGIPDMTGQDMSLEQLEHSLNDKLFSEVVSVGVNGGEPFLLSDLEQRVDIILKLPKISSLNIISNGILTQRILEKLETIHDKCKLQAVKVGITFSLDGYHEVHDSIRGIKGAFDKTVTTIQAIQRNMQKYCEHIGIICTVSNYNIYSLNELTAFAELNDLPKIDFQLAVEHKRLNNADKVADFSITANEYHKMLAMEFFYTLFLKTNLDNYYFIYKYLESDCTRRMTSCPWADRDVTLDASGNLFYCAVNSKQIGTLTDDLYGRFFDNENLDYRKSLVKTHCPSCIHYNNSAMYLKSYIDINSHRKDRYIWYLNYLLSGVHIK